ncbi:MAG: 4Fe-4S cluster-binding domain-containing protein [Synergistaceae bacterium]|nr:4Fe-4S cluster-binding domain-containing protein [Synergistaceae bacterium]
MRKNLDRYMNRPQTKIVILTLTNSCNLSCVYCYEHNKEACRMTYELAEEIIAREMTANDGSDFVCIYYFGGEPFTEFGTVKRIHSYLKSRIWPKKWFTFCTTNGTLVHGGIQKWLLENDSTIEVYLSIDGTEEMHNANRSGSYSRIDVKFFAEHFPFAKMTLTPKTLPGLSAGVIHLHGLGFEVSANIGHGIRWSSSDPAIFAEQLNILTDFYLSHPEYKPVNTLDAPITELDPGTSTPRRFCGVGPLMKSYDNEGSVYPCHAFAPLCIGKERAEEAQKLDFSKPLELSELDEKCRSCPIIGHCPTCYGINLGASGNVYHVPEDHCSMMKIQFMAGAKFKFMLYKSGRLQLTPEEEVKFLRNIAAIQTLKL